MSERLYTLLDQIIIQADQAITAAFEIRHTANRISPAAGMAEHPLTEKERRHAAGLMRVNHAGEISAQALYQGQALTSRNPVTRHAMQKSAEEEADHLAWCQQRLGELNDRTSLLNPVWYLGSFTIGTTAGLAGDEWSLGFVAETENQVVEHLENHLQKLPENDLKSRSILQQMVEDEAAHGDVAMRVGGRELPALIKTAMRFCSSIMTRTAYWI